MVAVTLGSRGAILAHAGGTLYQGDGRDIKPPSLYPGQGDFHARGMVAAKFT